MTLGFVSPRYACVVLFNNSLVVKLIIDSTVDSPETTVARSEQIDRLREAIRELRSEEQEVFLLRQNGDLTYEQIADTIGIPIGTVKTRMRLALTRLRKALN